MKEEFPPPPEKVLQAEKEIDEGTVDEHAWSLAKEAGINEHDIEIHYMNIRIGQLKAEEHANRFSRKLVTKVTANWKLILVCFVVLILIAGIVEFGIVRS